MTVGLERAHAQLLGQGQGLAVVGDGLGDVRGLAMPGDLTEEPAGMRLVAMPGVGGERSRSRAARALASSTRPTSRHASLSSVSTSAWRSVRLPVARRSSIWSRSGRASAVRPARAYAALKSGGCHGEEHRDVDGLGERQAPFQHRDGLLEHPLAAVEQPNTPEHDNHTVRLRYRLSQAYGCFAYPRPLGEVPRFGQTQGGIATGEYAREDGEAEALSEALPREHRDHPLRAVQRLPKVPCGIVRRVQVALGVDLDVERATAGGQGQGLLAGRDSTVMLAHDREGEAQKRDDLPEPLGVAQPLGQGFGGAEVLEDARLFVERQQGITQIETQINGLCQRLVALGEMASAASACS